MISSVIYRWPLMYLSNLSDSISTENVCTPLTTELMMRTSAVRLVPEPVPACFVKLLPTAAGPMLPVDAAMEPVTVI